MCARFEPDDDVFFDELERDESDELDDDFDEFEDLEEFEDVYEFVSPAEFVFLGKPIKSQGTCSGWSSLKSVAALFSGLAFLSFFFAVDLFVLFWLVDAVEERDVDDEAEVEYLDVLLDVFVVEEGEEDGCLLWDATLEADNDDGKSANPLSPSQVK